MRTAFMQVVAEELSMPTEQVRVAALDTHVPYEPGLEHAMLPQVDDIAAAAVALAGYRRGA